MSITIEQARKVLGKKAEKLSDTEVQKLLEAMYSFANMLVDKKLESVPK